VADDSISIIADENFIPTTWVFPAIGLKDGPVSASGTRKRVHVIAYVEYQEGDAAIIGQTSPLIKGILDMRADIMTALFDNILGISGILCVDVPDEAESELVAGEQGIALVKKRMTFDYEDRRSP
jgi:hypothetical protein